MYFFCINKSGVTIPVYSSYIWDDQSVFKQIGVIYDREACSVEFAEAGYGIYFSDPSGKLTLGYHPLTNRDGTMADLHLYFDSCLDHPYEKEEIKGITYWTFKFRRSEEVYTAAGTRWGTVAAGMRVATRSQICGENHPDWLQIKYVERSTDGEWIPVTGDGYSHGFVDTGLNVSSFPSSISMYGTW